MLAYHLQNRIAFFADELHLNGENLFFRKFFYFGRSVRMKCFLTYRTWNNYVDFVLFLEIKVAINQAAFPFGVVKCVRIREDVSRRWFECIDLEFWFLRFSCRRYRIQKLNFQSYSMAVRAAYENLQNLPYITIEAGFYIAYFFAKSNFSANNVLISDW